MSKPIDFLKLLRPRQWIKSGFVFIGLIFGHLWGEWPMVLRVLYVAIAFSLVASGVYILNDLADRESDAVNQRKRTRPIASGAVSTSTAIVAMIVVLALGFLIGAFASTTVALILAIYLVLNVAYSLGLKHVVILDVFIIASGFILRLLAGTTGVGIEPSHWLLLCGLMMALFLGFAKRRAELYSRDDDPNGHRPVLEKYQSVFLDKMIVITAACVILSYALYTLSPETLAAHHTQGLVYTIAFVIYGVFRYVYSLHSKTTGTDPAQEILRDPHLLLSVAGWLALTVWILRRH